MIQVTHFHRRPLPSHKSIERLFAGIRAALPASIQCQPHVCPHASRGFRPRLANILDARRHQRAINHITGDVHYLALGLPPARTVLTIHDCAALERLRGWRRAVLKLFWFTLPLRRARWVTVVSESTRQELLRHVRCDAAKIRVVPNCVGPEFTPAPKPFPAADSEVLHLGTGANKNLERLAEALRGLACRLHVIGRLQESQHAALGRCQIRFTNTANATDAEVLAAYQRCDLVAFVSTYEGFGLPILEANAVGRPVVTSNLLSMPEAAGNAACLVNPFEVSSIRAGMVRLLNSPGYRAALVQAGFQNVKRFAPSAIAAQYAALYQEMLSHD